MGATIPDGFWTEERTALLLRRDSEGARAAAIAAELGQGATRNAVLGKLHRLGDARAPRPIDRPSRPVARSRPAPVADAAPMGPTPAPDVPADAVTSSALLPRTSVRLDALGTLEAGCRKCRYPFGTGLGTRYCGVTTTEPGQPYCAEHAAICFLTSPDSRRERARGDRRLSGPLRAAS